ncbi:alpha/beta hydrolase fold domain-containing protein [Lutibacter sp. A64]|uniref:alpha/beta hydrolase family protein n=1 Tax=Lutibacter sp. A64 TaxID=2918526 RepID=UPI001F05D2E3|nr:alpha/beta hydrolase fold domain-containing protein [Lutibacter sp. A64]UMB52975.1 alpha/beta hydrolase fold domain-containing protein [Lutibacter sp. A64]
MITKTNIQVKSTQHNKPILTDVFYKKDNIKKPIVIFCHGYKGFKDWGGWNLAAPEFVNANLFFLKFNFSHNGGTVENPINFPDLEAFGHNNFITELDDLEDIINWIVTNPYYKEEIDPNNITLIGHSRGGGIVTLKASENNRVSKLISWAGVSDFGMRFPKDEKILQHWEKEGVSYIENSRTKQQMPHYFQFYTSFKENEARLTIKNAVQKLIIPHLIIQGKKDEVVPPIEAENLHSWNPKSILFMIDEMNHPLGCSEPYTAPKMPTHLAEVVAKSIEFILTK